MTLEEKLNAQDDITRLIFAYCTGIDSGQLDDTARLFTKGTWYLNPATPFKGFEDVSNFLHENVLLYNGVPGTRHVVSNLRIDLADDGQSAHAASYVIVYQTVDGSAPQIIFQGAYDDTFERSNGQWHFDERHIVTDGIGDMSKHLKAAQPEGSTTL